MSAKRTSILVVALIVSSIQFANAQEPRKIPKIGYLGGRSASTAVARVDALRRGLRQLGYSAGQNIEIEFRYAEGNLDRMPVLAAELVQTNVALIVAGNDEGIRAAQQANKNMPILFSALGDPMGLGFVSSLARPGGHITVTTSSTTSDTTRKRVEILKEAVPKFSCLAVILNPSNLAQKQYLKDSEEVAKVLDLELKAVGLERPSDLDNAFAVITKERADGLLLQRSPIISLSAKRITDFAEKNRLPAIFGDSQLVEGGGLMSYAPDLLDLDRRTAIYIDKILQGAKPADLSVEGPKKFELVINLKAAQQIGLGIPETLLTRADRVIK